MSAGEHLSAGQFANKGYFGPEEIDTLRASDFPGSIGDAAARSRYEDKSLRMDRMRPEHRDGGPLAHLDRFTSQVSEKGRIEERVDVEAHDDYYKLVDGHHRAFAAHSLGIPLPYRIVKDHRNS